ncbi:hypothetical protein [Corynebacterium freiburgense]|uniref:hypothetical protein n=1 Tax=Corynebacterium freiburgense TaxID=556548 RepID=UPI0012EC8E1A|nr:hypothetical protein [Corynebacterium freiburgense]WJZ02609.1 hypothetical protein CFREI_06615 [Corynebacterium freiburgense]
MDSSLVLSGRLTSYTYLKLAAEHGENPGGRATVTARPTVGFIPCNRVSLGANP